MDGVSGAVAEALAGAVRIGDRQISSLDEAGNEGLYNEFHSLNSVALKKSGGTGLVGNRPGSGPTANPV
ncbi:hypothetical protein GCM10007923_44950 [Shinella yambaruensis]|uniref:Uncharacterized protein n=1 Tax=Shinella yambaruensis TaxID=415996 RepID=A0ABQ5ZMG4_9HYPH|nr:hypothetical protein GCM10007923_44950 [Shinella yambaruensis]